MVAGVWSDDNSQHLEAPTQFRKLLSIGNTEMQHGPSQTSAGANHSLHLSR